MLELTKVMDSKYVANKKHVATKQEIEKNGKKYNLYYIEDEKLYFKYANQIKG